MKITKVKSKAVEFKEVELREPLVDDVIVAESMATMPNGSVNNTKQGAALIARICKFDGKELPVEDVAQLPLRDFLGLVQESGLKDLQTSLGQSSTSSDTDS